MDGLFQITGPQDQARAALAGLWSSRASGLAEDALIHDSDAGSLTVHGMSALRQHLISSFPDLAAHIEDVIIGHDRALARLTLTATHGLDGPFGPATHKPVAFRCAVELIGRAETVQEVVLIRDQTALPPPVHQTVAPSRWHGGTEPAGPSDNPWAQTLCDIVKTAMDGDLSILSRAFDPGAEIWLPGGQTATGPEALDRFLLSLRGALPTADFTVQTVLGRDEALGSPCAALRWQLAGRHEGWGRYGTPGEEDLLIPGICFAEFGPRGIRRFWAVVDDAATWRRISACSA